MDKIRGKVKKILKEEMGVQIEIKELSKFMEDWILENLSFYLKQEKFKNNIEITIPYPTKIDKKVIDKTNIEKFKVNVLAERSDSEKVSGKFVPKNIFRIDVGFYIEINLNIAFVYDILKLKKEIISVINHELNHAFVYLKKYDNPSRKNTS